MKLITQEETWCPLTGDIGPPGGLYNKTIERAQGFWGAKITASRDSNGDVITCFYRPDNATIKKARRIYEKWMSLREGAYPFRGKVLEPCHTLNLLCNADENMRPVFISDITIQFQLAGINDVSIFEVLTIIVIAEAKVNIETDGNAALPFNLLRIAEDYTPNTLRGQKVIEGANKSGAARAAQIAEERREIWNRWQAIADIVWKKNPSLSKYAVATSIHKKLSNEQPTMTDSINTIRQRIKKTMT